MSRSLSRIRNLVSEIEEIHRQGQQGGKSALLRTAGLKAENPRADSQLSPVAPPSQPGLFSSESDSFSPLANLVDLEERRDLTETPGEAKVFMQLSGTVALSLQIQDSGESVELKQVGDLLEIRFADGKAFHIPLKAMA